MHSLLSKRKTLFLIADIFLIVLSVFLAFLVRFELIIPSQYFLNIERVIILVILITIPIFYFFKLYSFSWSYVSATELISLAKATSLSFLILVASFFIFRDHPIFSGFPRSTLFITYFFIFIFCGGIRFIKRIYLYSFLKNNNEKRERTLIVGAGDAGEQILRSILNLQNSPYLPIGFIDDNPAKKGEVIHGVKVLGNIDEIGEIAEKNLIEGIIIAMSSVGSKTIKKAVETARMAGLKKIRIIPPVSEIINGYVSIKNLREVQIEDLLGRPPVFLDTKLIEDFVVNKIILITGAAGSIGSELCRQVLRFKPRCLLLLDQDETGIFNISKELEKTFPELKKISFVVDIRDEEKIDHIFQKFHPHIVFHAAAYKHVPLMEAQPEEAIKNNIFGTETIVKTSLKYGAEKFVFISTDKAVNPTSVMGMTKRVGEMICQIFNQKNHTKFISVRFGNVLDSRGSVIPIFREQIKNGGPVEVTHPEMKRYFMVTSEACLLVMQAATMGEGGEVFVLDMGKPINILDLAKEMIRLSGLGPDKDIPIVFTGPRPGEKLFEEILTAEEGIIATKNKQIFIAKMSKINTARLEKNLDKLKKLIKEFSREELIGKLKEIV